MKRWTVKWIIESPPPPALLKEPGLNIHHPQIGSQCRKKNT